MLRLKLFVLLLAMSCCAALAFAQSAASALEPPDSDTQRLPTPVIDRALVHKPPIEPLQAAFDASKLPWVFVRATVDYDAVGNAVNVTLSAPSGDKALDLAILNWATETRITPANHPLQYAELPFEFFSQDVLCESEEERRPSCLHDFGPDDFDGPLLKPIDLSIFALWGGDEALLEMYFEYDASGKLSHLFIAQPVSGRGFIRKDALRLRAVSTSGYGRLRLRLIAVADAREAAMKTGDDVVLVWKTRSGDERLLVDKDITESRLSIMQIRLPANVLGDVRVAQIFHDAMGRIIRIEPVMKPGDDPKALQSVMDELLKGVRLKKVPGRAGSLQAKVYPDGSVIPVD